MTLSLPGEAAVLRELKDIFPHHSQSLLRNAATQHNFDLELTVANLLSDSTSDPKPLQVPQLQQPKAWLRKGKPKVRSGGWSALSNGGPAAGGAFFQPQHAAQHSKPPADDSGEFPSLGGGSEGATQQQSINRDRGRSAGAACGNRLCQTPTQTDNRGPAAQPTAGDASNDSAAALGKDFARVLGKSDSAKREAEFAEQQRQQTAVAELLSLHPWAGRDLVHAVLAGLGGDRQAAAQCLDEMLAARVTQQRRSSDMARRSSDSGAMPSAGHTPDAALQDAATGGGAAAAGPAAHAWPAEPPGDHELAADLAEEPYRHHRGAAIKLTHAWQRGMHQAAAAFAAGDKAAASRIAQAARRKRDEALRAHEEAAQRILHDNNAARGRAAGELDLHGLHASEAVAALERHLHGLEADTGSGAAAVDHVRVIVGRGRHSAGGEASLPRAVEGYLMDQGRKYTAKRGAIEVHLRRGRRPASAPVAR